MQRCAPTPPGAGSGINFPDSNGRGFAAQQLVEEFQARKELSKKVGVCACVCAFVGGGTPVNTPPGYLLLAASTRHMCKELSKTVAGVLPPSLLACLRTAALRPPSRG